MTSSHATPRRLRPLDYAATVAIVTACTLVSWAMFPLSELANIAMVYLLGIVIVSVVFGRWPSIVTSVLAVAAFDFFFVPPTSRSRLATLSTS